MGKARDIANVLTTIQNIDVSSSLDSRIFISSASPSTGNTNGRVWIDPTTASAPVVSIYGGGTWNSFRQGRIKAEGGIKSFVGNYTVHKFTSSSSFICYENLNIEYLIVAGGGGGGVWVSGGGGGGGVLSGSTSINASTYSITVGSGGNGAYAITSGPTLTTLATNGNNSVAFGLTATGGGRGASWTLQDGSTGGSGGGRDQTWGTTRLTGISGQGYAGGISIYLGNYPGTGGGGAGGQGGDAASGTAAGSGGSGVLNSIDGTSSYYAGGGGGGLNTTPGTAGSGGIGGGGNGAVTTWAGGANPVPGSGAVATSGQVNTGGGGGGAGQNAANPNATGGNGGSGVVIIRYLT